MVRTEGNLKHIKLNKLEKIPYKGRANPQSNNVPERDRQQHAENLREQIRNIKQQAVEIKQRKESKNIRDTGVLLTVKGKSEYDLVHKGIENKRKNFVIVNSGETEDQEEYVVVRVPIQNLDHLEEKILKFQMEDTPSGKAKYQDMMNTIESISMALIGQIWVDDLRFLPEINETSHWWEIWLLGGRDNQQEARELRDEFFNLCGQYQIRYDDIYLQFQERQVILIYAKGADLAEIVCTLSTVVEIRRPSKAIADWYFRESGLNLSADSMEELLLSPSAEHNVHITLLDTGIAYNHPMLRKAIHESSLFSIDESGDVSDYNGHGTSMAGLLLYDNLANVITSGRAYQLPAWIESVRIPLAETNEGLHLWGSTIRSAIEMVEESSQNKRIYCMAISEDPNNQNVGSHELGKPSSWSATIDDLIYNDGENPRLFLIAAGNIQEHHIKKNTYPYLNLTSQLLDPAQSRNAITVGAMTDLDKLTDTSMEMLYTPVAEKGQMSPYSRSHLIANDAIKPDIVCEGGNVANDVDDTFCSTESGLCLVSTYKDVIHNPYTIFNATSAATANATRMLARIWNENPTLRLETIRGLLIHSATWTSQMKEQFSNTRDLLRACGYGVPNLELAMHSLTSRVTLIAETKIQAQYEKEVPEIDSMENTIKMVKKKVRDMYVYELPWPEELLLGLGDLQVELRVTLSYFMEPNPKRNFSKYEGAGLKWEMKKVDENDTEFYQRVNHAMRGEGEQNFTGDTGWTIGIQKRSRGTIQSDRWYGTAAELASRNKIAIYTTYGWWNDRKEFKDKAFNFSVIISIVTEESSIDLYTPISTIVENNNLVDVEI
ncbi:hypothetical protein COE22_12645 [Bacillus cereus]|uniref:S8 family peptidase n=1 Tax=Bacillus cereus TaxID=1396 RepID=UPI000BFB7863|nr:S8 family peptidase [Bacillus cereus]PGX26356.1 hypothetical protein COE22_12645 [Bacillus cereus]